MFITADYLRGHTDYILLSLLEKDRNYAYGLNQLISEKTNHQFELSEGTLYTACKRLVQQGALSAFWQDAPQGKRRHYYAITAKGLAHLEKGRREWQKTKAILDELL